MRALMTCCTPRRRTSSPSTASPTIGGVLLRGGDEVVNRRRRCTRRLFRPYEPLTTVARCFFEKPVAQQALHDNSMHVQRNRSIIGMRLTCIVLAHPDYIGGKATPEPLRHNMSPTRQNPCTT